MKKGDLVTCVLRDDSLEARRFIERNNLRYTCFYGVLIEKEIGWREMPTVKIDRFEVFAQGKWLSLTSDMCFVTKKKDHEQI